MVTADRIALVAAMGLVVAPAVAASCPACARASAEAATLYYVATGLMLATPIALLVGLLRWLRARARNAAQHVALLLLAALVPSTVGCAFEPATPITEDQVLGGATVAAAKLERGRSAYGKYCQPCHGIDGDGRGRSAEGLHTPPRDFRTASFKFAGATEGALPRDEGLAAVVRKGLHGTAMLPWDVPPAVVDDIVQYVKSFSPKGQGFRDPDMELAEPLAPGADPWAGRDAQAVDRGRAIYHGYATCNLCHPAYRTRAEINADRARFNIPPTYRFRPTPWLPDAKVSESYSRPLPGDPICGVAAPCAGADQVCRLGRCEEKITLMPPDFLLNSVRSGSTHPELFRVIATGIPGTAMPAWKGVMADKDLWALAHYIGSLVAMKDAPQSRSLRARLMADTTPMGPPPAPAPPPPPPAPAPSTPPVAPAPSSAGPATAGRP